MGSADIIDGEVKSVDIGNDEVGSADVKDNSLNTFDVHSFIGEDVIDNTLTGADINEATLDLPKAPTVAAFSGNSSPLTLAAGTFREITGRTLTAGNYGLWATVNTHRPSLIQSTTICELREAGLSSFLGGATMTALENTKETSQTLSMNGGISVPAGQTRRVTVHCKNDLQNTTVTYSQLMVVRLDGFF